MARLGFRTILSGLDQVCRRENLQLLFQHKTPQAVGIFVRGEINFG